jgi:hypothetical protein
MYNSIAIMDDHTYENWVRVKESLEESGKTDNMFYQRACAIVKGEKDPLSKMLGDKDK